MATFVEAVDGQLINLDYVAVLRPHRHDAHSQTVVSYLCISAYDHVPLGEVRETTLRACNRVWHDRSAAPLPAVTE